MLSFIKFITKFKSELNKLNHFLPIFTHVWKLRFEWLHFILHTFFENIRIFLNEWWVRAWGGWKDVNFTTKFFSSYSKMAKYLLRIISCQYLFIKMKMNDLDFILHAYFWNEWGVRYWNWVKKSEIYYAVVQLFTIFISKWYIPKIIDKSL